MSRVAYVNGTYRPLREAVVHVEDRGFQFADGVYEVWSVFDGRMADFDGHMARLHRSLNELRIDIPMSREALRRVLNETVRRNRVREGLVYIQVTRGTAARRLWRGRCAAREDHAEPCRARRSGVAAGRAGCLAPERALL